MKRISKIVSLATALVFFSACGNENSTKEQNDTGSSKVATINIDEGTYIVPEDEKADEGSGYLALKVRIKNKGKEILSVSPEDINLYDKEENKVSRKDIYIDDSNFKLFKFESVSGGKSTDGYVIFKVEKDKQYDLQYTPDGLIDSKQKPIQIDIDAKKYKDVSSEVQSLTEDFVNSVFLNKEDAGKESKLGNDLEQDKATFDKEFSKRLGEEFGYYKPSESELMNSVNSLKNANGKKAKVSYSIKELYPDSATIYVNPETIHFSNVDVDSIVEDFVNKNIEKYTDYEKAEIDAEKYLLDQLPQKFENTTISKSNNSMSGEGFEVHLTKKDDKWVIDTSDSDNNYTFKYLKQSFMGDLYY